MPKSRFRTQLLSSRVKALDFSSLTTLKRQRQHLFLSLSKRHRSPKNRTTWILRQLQHKKKCKKKCKRSNQIIKIRKKNTPKTK